MINSNEWLTLVKDCSTERIVRYKTEKIGPLEYFTLPRKSLIMMEGQKMGYKTKLPKANTINLCTAVSRFLFHQHGAGNNGK